MKNSDTKAQLIPLLEKAAKNPQAKYMQCMSISEEEEFALSEPAFIELGHTLLKMDEVAIFRRGNMQYLPTSAKSTSIWYLTRWLVKRAQVSGSAEAALDDLFNYIENPEMVVHHIQPLAEIEFLGLEKPREFPNDVILRHSNSVPNTDLSLSLSQPGHGVLSLNCNFSLTQEHRYKAPLGKTDTAAEWKKVQSAVDVELSTIQLEDVIFSLSLASGVENGVFGTSRTFVPDTRIPYAISSSTWHLQRHATPEFFCSLSPSHIDDAVRFAEHLNRLDQKAADRIRVPLRHLNLFGARLPSVEKAFHLRVALETTFLEETKNDSITHRLITRAAIVTGSNLEERRGIRSALKKAYNAASGAVHKGTLTPADREKLVKAAEICRTALIFFLENGGLPEDWFKVDTEGITRNEHIPQSQD